MGGLGRWFRRRRKVLATVREMKHTARGGSEPEPPGWVLDRTARMLLGLENGPTVRELAAILGGLAARYAKESQTLEATEHAQAIADWELRLVAAANDATREQLRKKRPLPDAPLDRARLLEVIGAAYDRGDMFVQKLQAAADDAERRARGEA